MRRSTSSSLTAMPCTTSRGSAHPVRTGDSTMESYPLTCAGAAPRLKHLRDRPRRGTRCRPSRVRRPASTTSRSARGPTSSGCRAPVDRPFLGRLPAALLQGRVPQHDVRLPRCRYDGLRRASTVADRGLRPGHRRPHRGGLRPPVALVGLSFGAGIVQQVAIDPPTSCASPSYGDRSEERRLDLGLSDGRDRVAPRGTRLRRRPVVGGDGRDALRGDVLPGEGAG